MGHKFNLVSQWCFVRFWRLCSTFWKACLFPIRKQKNIFREKFFFSWKKYFFWNFVIPSKLFFGKFWASLSTWYNNDSRPGKKEKKLFYCCCLWDFIFASNIGFDVGDLTLVMMVSVGLTSMVPLRRLKKKKQIEEKIAKSTCLTRTFFFCTS